MSDGDKKQQDGNDKRIVPGYMPEIREADTLNSPPIPIRPSKGGDSGSGGSDSGSSSDK
jgi:hypothetical protein